MKFLWFIHFATVSVLCASTWNLMHYIFYHFEESWINWQTEREKCFLIEWRKVPLVHLGHYYWVNEAMKTSLKLSISLFTLHRITNFYKIECTVHHPDLEYNQIAPKRDTHISRTNNVVCHEPRGMKEYV